MMFCCLACGEVGVSGVSACSNCGARRASACNCPHHTEQRLIVQDERRPIGWRNHKFLRFNDPEPSPSGKTYIVQVHNDRGTRLGEIKWYGGGRTYAFYPVEQTLYTWDCMGGIAARCQDLMLERQAKGQVEP